MRAFDYIVTISFGCILHCVCFNLYCGGFILFCNVCVCVCVCVCMCGFCNVCVCVSVLVICVLYSEVFLNLTEVFLTLTELFPCFFLSCKANAKGKTRKDGARPAVFHISCYLCFSVVICVVLCIVCV